VLVAGIAAGLPPACATYRPAPLPPAHEVAERGMPDLERLEVEAAELKHPILKPVTLDLSDGLSPDEAAVLAVLANPDLAAVRDAHGEAAAQLLGAGLLPNPDLSAEVDRPHGTGSQGTVNAYNVGLGVDIGSLIGRAARVAAASAQLQAVDLGIAWQEWQVAQAARLTTARVAMLERRLGLIRSELKFENETVTVLQRALDEGDATVQDLGIHRSALESLRQLEGDLVRAETETRSRLFRLLGLPPGAQVKVTPLQADPSFPALPDPSKLVERAVKTRLDLRALELGYRSQEARVRQAVLAQFPSLSIGVTAQRNETALKFLGGFVTLGLPIFNRNQGAIALERATRTRLKHEYEARIATVRTDVDRLAADDALLDRQILVARRGIFSLSHVEAAERNGVLSGDVGRLAWQDVRSTLLDMRLKLATLNQARIETRVALQTAVGSSLAGHPGATAPPASLHEAVSGGTGSN